MKHIDKNAGRSEYLLDELEFDKTDSSAIIKLPYLFPVSGNRLELSVTEYNGSVFVTDGGAAFRELALRTRDPYILENVFEYLTSVYLSVKPTKQKEIVWAIAPSDMSRFYRILQCISLCANVDLYPAVDREKLKEYEKHMNQINLSENGSYPSSFVESLQTSLCWRDEDLINTRFAFTDEMSAMSILLTEEQDNRLALTDKGDFDGGDLIERIKWNNKDNYHQFDGFINKVCERFNAEYNGFKVRYTKEIKDNASLLEAIFTFMQIVSILGEVGLTVKTI